MKGSPVFPGFDNDYIDLQNDFSKFLEEARNHLNGEELFPRESEKIQQFNVEEKRKKKSWKNALFSFFKSSEKKVKNKSKQCFVEDFHLGNPKRRAHVSGPVHCHQWVEPVSNDDVRHRLRASGPIAGLFQGKKRVEMGDIPYVSLDMLDRPQNGVKAYGPIYLVS